MAEDPQDLPHFDAARLADEIKRGDAEALAQAAKQVFDTGLGRHVLAAFLLENGVGAPLGRQGMSAEELFYLVGRHDAALSLAHTVYDQASLVVDLFKQPTPGREESHDEPALPLEGEFASGLGDVRPDLDFG